jgi:hypothetical protein
MSILNKTDWQCLALTLLISLAGCGDSENPIQIPGPVDYDPYVEIVDSETALKPRFKTDDDIPDTKLWVTERDCQPETITWTMKQGPFEIVERLSERAHMTAAEFMGDAPPLNSSIAQVTLAYPHPKHQAGLASDGVFQTELFFANMGDDVEISTYHWARRFNGKLGDLGYTVLVNYQAVDSTYRLWDHGRREILAEVQDSGWTFRRRSNIHIVDLKIPASAFKEPGAYTITVLITHQVDHWVHTFDTRRYTVLYGDYTMKQSVCVRSPLAEPVSEFERIMGRNTMRQIGAFERDSLGMRYALSHPDGGVWIDWTLFRYWFERRQMLAIVPLVDSRPATEPIFTWSGGDDGVNETLETVDDRGSFWVDLEGREKKDVMVAVFPDPFMPSRNLDGDIFYGVGMPESMHSYMISVSSFRDDSDRCDPQDGPCIDWRD